MRGSVNASGISLGPETDLERIGIDVAEVSAWDRILLSVLGKTVANPMKDQIHGLRVQIGDHANGPVRREERG